MSTEYPKIETLYDRDETFKVTPPRLRLAEFGIPRVWHVTEKVDGTNIRLSIAPDGTVTYGGKTDNAQIPSKLVAYLLATVPAEKVLAAFPERDGAPVVVYGEGYGAGIQKGGIYRRDMALRIFDVRVGGWWLEPANVADVAEKLGVRTVPSLGTIGPLPTSKEDMLGILRGGNTRIAEGGSVGPAEGIVARTVPLLLTRRGERLMWKLKLRDFAE